MASRRRPAFRPPLRALLLAGVAATIASCGPGDDFPTVPGPTPPTPTLADPVLRWNHQALEAVKIDHTPPLAHLPGSDVPGAGDAVHAGPCRSARVLAILHVAIYDAVMNVVQTHEPFVVDEPVAGTTSVEAAIARAAYDILSHYYPAQTERLLAALLADLAEIPAGAAKEAGLALGAHVAEEVLAAKSDDGADVEYPGNSPYTPSDQPGFHRVDPTNPGQPFLTPAWGTVTPIGIASAAPYAAVPVPALDGAQYAAAFNDVKALGGDGVTTPTVRTAEQTEIGIFWAYDGVPGLGPPPRLYNQIVTTIALQEGNTVAENARLFALVNVALCDAGIVSWATKYSAEFWRPIVAIREADPGTGPTGLGDGNPATTGDTSWTPLGAPSTNSDAPNFTPPFPAYTSGHATFGAACFRMLANFYGTDAISFTIGSDEFNGVNRENASSPTPRPVVLRSFSSFSEAADENGRSRIYLGIHWSFDDMFGRAQGGWVADEVFAAKAQPTP
jgi:hypothetical protein